jgi:uncharacterized protein (TIGR02452 family)
MNRQNRTLIAQQTIDIIKLGRYTPSSGRPVDISGTLKGAIANTRLYRPGDFPNDIKSNTSVDQRHDTIVELTPETTLEAARRLTIAGAEEDLVCLNFASAKNPGNGFLSGSQAQEESLARSSGLYPCISQMAEMYDHNRRLGTCLYSDHMIYSPGVPVFRDDSGKLLEAPYKLAFITAPAVNAGAVMRNEPARVNEIKATMESRLRKILWVAEQNRHQRLILGAWGCGVFGNSPATVATIFSEAMGPAGPFHGCFKQVVYAIYDRSSDQAIAKAFAHLSSSTPPH